MKYDVATVIGIIVVVVSLSLAITISSAKLPSPPKYTQKEMREREAKWLDNHEKTCYTCKETRDGFWVFCDESAKVQDLALTIGNWKMYPLGWVWRGPPQWGATWDYHSQQWRRAKMR
jgi:hypothetical protein